MRIIEPYVVIETPLDGDQILQNIERAARTCYKSEGKATCDSAPGFVRRLLHQLHHESTIEHEVITVRFVTDRGVTHEIVRHRLAAFSQESTRYCNYSDNKFGNEVTFIRPPVSFWHDDLKYATWQRAMQAAEHAYLALLDAGAKPQEARSVLPNSLKTEIVMTANLREWRHVFKLRTATAAHPQMRQVMQPLLKRLQAKVPVIFEDIIPGELVVPDAVVIDAVEGGYVHFCRTSDGVQNGPCVTCGRHCERPIERPAICTCYDDGVGPVYGRDCPRHSPSSTP